MLSRLYSVRPQAWWLLFSLALLASTSAIARSTDLIGSKAFLYYVQPTLALAIFGSAIYIARGKKDRVRHRSEKAFLVGSVLAVWFAIYFLSGLATTYVNNSLVSSPKSVFINLWTFGVVSFAVEFARHRLMLVVNRRNMVWFGVVVALVLAVQQMNFGLVQQAYGVDEFIKLGISDFVPAIASSFLLTYLAITGGLPAMMVYRLGLIAALILPPIIPKHDWYLQGMSLILLAVAIFIAMDRSRQDKKVVSRHHYYRNPRRAYDIMSLIVMAVFVMFVVGVFSYKPSVIVSNSMKPVFSRGSVVVVQKSDAVDVKVGDIVQYTRKEKTITHRVVEIDAASDGSGKRMFVIKGDNNDSKDPLVSDSQIIGIVRSTVPYIGYPTVLLRDLSRPR